MTKAFVTVNLDLPDHPKVLRLARSMGWSENEALGSLVQLYIAVQRYCPDGDVSGWSDEEVGRYARVPGPKRADFCKTLRALRVIVDGKINGWGEHNHYAKRLHQLELDRQRKRAKSETSEEDPQKVHGTSMDDPGSATVKKKKESQKEKVQGNVAPRGGATTGEHSLDDAGGGRGNARHRAARAPSVRPRPLGPLTATAWGVTARREMNDRLRGMFSEGRTSGYTFQPNTGSGGYRPTREDRACADLSKLIEAAGIAPATYLRCVELHATRVNKGQELWYQQTFVGFVRDFQDVLARVKAYAGARERRRDVQKLVGSLTEAATPPKRPPQEV